MQLRICVKFGWTPAELKQRMSETDFQLLSLYYGIEPWGSELEQLNAGVVAATLANCRQGRGRGSKTVVPLDFMPIQQRLKKKRARMQTPGEIEKMLRGFAIQNTHVKITEQGDT